MTECGGLSAGTLGRSKLGSYDVLGRLGSGGMGDVYLAQDTKLGRRVALKVLRANLGGESDEVRRLVREAKAAAALTHPNVATIYEINEVNGVHFIVMEYVEGDTLKTKIANNSLVQNDLQSVAMQI